MIYSNIFNRFTAVPLFFVLKLGSGLILLKMSTVSLSVGQFSVFSQLLLFGALLNMICVGGIQNGLVRQFATNASSAERSQSIAAALIIWIGAFIFVGLSLFILREHISTILVGDAYVGSQVGSIILAVFIAGPAQIFFAQLTGIGRVPISLMAQGIGLIISTSVCIFFLYRGNSTAAACAFYWASIPNVMIALFFSRNETEWSNFYWSEIVSKITDLLRYSLAFLALVLITGITLFSLRYVYQENFGLDKLSFWLAAQRVSDTSTQLLGLYMIQLFMPKLVGSKTGGEDNKIIFQGWVIATAAMACFLLFFAIMPEFIVRTFLSEKFLPAANLILLYMVGDVFRATASLAMHAAFAKKKLFNYVAIEAFSMMIFAAITLWLIYNVNANAPFFAYVAAFGITASIVVVFHIWRNYKKLHI